MVDGISHREEILDAAFVVVDFNDDIDRVIDGGLFNRLAGVRIVAFTNDRFCDPDALAFCLSDLNFEGNEILNPRIEVAESRIPYADFF